MGCSNNRKIYLDKLFRVSEGSIKESQAEEIMMKTYFSIKELYYLYLEFAKLNPDSNGYIKVSSFFEFPPIKYCSFRRYLIYAFGFNIDILNKEEKDAINKNLNKSEKSKILEKDLKDNEVKPNVLSNKQMTKKDLKNLNRKIKLNSDDDLVDINNNLKLKDNLFFDTPKPLFNSNNNNNKAYDTNDILKLENNLDDNNLIGNNNYIYYEDLEDISKRKMTNISRRNYIANQSINFNRFCNYLKVFNIKYPIDFKIKFYFKIFDTDGDGYLSKENLKEFILTVMPIEDLNNNSKNNSFDVKNNLINVRNNSLSKLNKNISNTKNRYRDYDNVKRDIQSNNINNEEEENIEYKLNEINKEEEEQQDMYNNKFDIDKIIDIIFTEITGSKERMHISFNEFEKVLWTSNIDSKCVMYFGN